MWGDDFIQSTIVGLYNKLPLPANITIQICQQGCAQCDKPKRIILFSGKFDNLIFSRNGHIFTKNWPIILLCANLIARKTHSVQRKRNTILCFLSFNGNFPFITIGSSLQICPIGGTVSKPFFTRKRLEHHTAGHWVSLQRSSHGLSTGRSRNTSGRLNRTTGKWSLC